MAHPGLRAIVANTLGFLGFWIPTTQLRSPYLPKARMFPPIFIKALLTLFFLSIFSLMKKRGISDAYFDSFNYENYGGTPILGIRGNVIIGHGISNDIAIKNMLLHSYEVASSGLAKKIKKAFK